jgi:hypothetical protein
MRTQVLQNEKVCATISHDDLRSELERIERQLIPLLISVQKALGKEPTVTTREQRRNTHN